MSNPYNWYYWTDYENMKGPYSTKEEAIVAGREDWDPDHRGFYVGKYCRAELNFDIDIDRIISDIEEQNAEHMGDDGVIFDVVSKEEIAQLEDQLQKVMMKFVDDHPKLKEAAWALSRNPKIEDEHIPYQKKENESDD